MYNGHITDINIEDNMIAFEVDCGYSDYVKMQLCHLDMSKEELIEEKQKLEEKNIVKMYNKKLSDIENMKEQVEQMKDQLNVLKAEIIATQEEAELLVTDDIKIGVRFFDTYRDYKFKSAGVLGMEVLLAVSYQDKQIYEPSMKPDVFTEEIVKDMEEQAEIFEKVLDIVKEEC